MQYLSRDLNPQFLLSLKKFRKRVRERRVNENNRADGSKSRRIPAKNHTKNNKKEIFFISLNKKKDHREN